MNQNLKNKIAVLIIAYNRIESIKRLIKSVMAADYLGDNVDLIISIDNSGSPAIADYANSIEWVHGEFIVVEHPVKLGLKAHVLECGNYTKDYESLCVLEDDIYVSPGFYNFAKLATRQYRNNDEIAGISLYTHEWNQYVNRPFIPVADGYDIFFMQIASSWGQIWSKKSWTDFMEWINGKSDKDLVSVLLPKQVSSWSSKSWLKYHNMYLVERNKFFVYPRESLSTNFSDAGEHATVNTVYQVSLLTKVRNNYLFPLNIDDGVRYDAFFENMGYGKILGISDEELDVNLYGNRVNSKKYLLSTSRINYSVCKSFELKFRPIDLNIINQLEGDDIYLYDTTRKISTRKISFWNNKKLRYDLRTNAKKDMFLNASHLYLVAILRRVGINL